MVTMHFEEQAEDTPQSEYRDFCAENNVKCATRYQHGMVLGLQNGWNNTSWGD